MEPFFERQYLMEADRQCRHALRAISAVNSALDGPLDAEALFFHLHAFLVHVAAVSRLFWPGSSRRSDTGVRAKARGEDLRRRLKLKEQHPVASRDLRNHLEHYDERVDSWVQESTHHNLSTDSVGPISVFSGPTMSARDVLRHYDRDARAFVFRGEEFPLQPIVDGLLDMRERIAQRVRGLGAA